MEGWPVNILLGNWSDCQLSHSPPSMRTSLRLWLVCAPSVHCEHPHASCKKMKRGWRSTRGQTLAATWWLCGSGFVCRCWVWLWSQAWLSLQCLNTTFTVLIQVNLVSNFSLFFIPLYYPHFVGLVGLAISYALSVTNLLSGVVTSFTETEKEMVSVERAMQYINETPAERRQGQTEVLNSNMGSLG